MNCVHGYPQEKCQSCYLLPEALNIQLIKLERAGVDNHRLEELISSANAKITGRPETVEMPVNEYKTKKSHKFEQRVSKKEEPKPKAVMRNDGASVKKDYTGQQTLFEIVIAGLACLVVVSAIGLCSLAIKQYYDQQPVEIVEEVDETGTT